VSEALVPSEVIPAGGSIETPPGAPRIERADEEPDRWTGTTRIERDGCPVLHTTVGLGPAAPARLPPAAPRAYASTVLLAPADPRPEVEVITGDDAVRLPLPGGWVGTAWGRELVDTVARLATLDGAVAALETAR
jgi:urease accessory protein